MHKRICIIKYFIVLFSILELTFSSCENHGNVRSTVSNSIDSNIVLVNIGSLDRAGIAELILLIDSCKPTLIAIDAIFDKVGTPENDLSLEKAFKKVENDIVGSYLDSSFFSTGALPRFKKYISGEGYTNVIKSKGLSAFFMPVTENKGKYYYSFSMEIVKLWKQSSEFFVHPNEVVRIDFLKNQNQFRNIDGVDFNVKTMCPFLKDMIVLVGYLGPGPEDKHYTPFRTTGDFSEEEPDTYGLIIVANQVRTILNRKKQDN